VLTLTTFLISPWFKISIAHLLFARR
jgi:hypothetical protein